MLTCGDFFGNRFAKRLRDTVAAVFSRGRHDLCHVPLRQGVWLADAEETSQVGRFCGSKPRLRFSRRFLSSKKSPHVRGRRSCAVSRAKSAKSAKDGGLWGFAADKPLRACTHTRFPNSSSIDDVAINIPSESRTTEKSALYPVLSPLKKRKIP